MSRAKYSVLALPATLLFLAMAGCASTPAAPSTPRPELIAVAAQCPAPNIPAKPSLPVAQLTPNTSDDATISAYAESLRLCAEYSQKLLTILKAYQP